MYSVRLEHKLKALNRSNLFITAKRFRIIPNASWLVHIVELWLTECSNMDWIAEQLRLLPKAHYGLYIIYDLIKKCCWWVDERRFRSDWLLSFVSTANCLSNPFEANTDASYSSTRCVHYGECSFCLSLWRILLLLFFNLVLRCAALNHI